MDSTLFEPNIRGAEGQPLAVLNLDAKSLQIEAIIGTNVYPFFAIERVHLLDPVFRRSSPIGKIAKMTLKFT